MICDLDLTYNDDRWATIISPDQVGCNQYLSQNLDLLNGKDVLHVGIGNSSIVLEFGNNFGRVDGITIMDSEIAVAERLKADHTPGANPYHIFKFNKYDKHNFAKLPNYDLIIDNNAKQHACCQNHWEDYFAAILGKLRPNGCFLTHTQGFAPHTNKVGWLSVEELRKLTPSQYVVEEKQSFANEGGHYPVLIRLQNDA